MFCVLCVIVELHTTYTSLTEFMLTNHDY